MQSKPCGSFSGDLDDYGLYQSVLMTLVAVYIFVLFTCFYVPIVIHLRSQGTKSETRFRPHSYPMPHGGESSQVRHNSTILMPSAVFRSELYLISHICRSLLDEELRPHAFQLKGIVVKRSNDTEAKPGCGTKSVSLAFVCLVLAFPDGLTRLAYSFRLMLHLVPFIYVRVLSSRSIIDLHESFISICVFRLLVKIRKSIIKCQRSAGVYSTITPVL